MVQLLECENCHLAKSASPQVWMEHIASNHIIPTEWPSDRAKRLTGADALRPYSTVADSKKKRKKDSIARPLNSFMIFSQYIRRNVLEVFKEHANADMSKQLGKLWGNLGDHFKDQYHEEAERMARLHDLEFPHYKYQPRKGKRNENLSIQGSNTHLLTAATNNEMYKHNQNMITSSPSSLGHSIVQVTCSNNSQPRPQLLQTSANPISVVSTSLPLILTSASAFNTSNQQSLLDNTKHIVCKPINSNSDNQTSQISYLANSDSAYSSEIGSSSNSSIPSPAIGDFLIQSPVKHYIDDRNNTIHHWNVNNRRYYQTPRQASASSVPEFIPSAGNTPEIDSGRKRFYSGTNESNSQAKLACIPDENDNETLIELDVIDQNGNKMKLRIENGSKEMLKSLLLSNQEKQQMNQNKNDFANYQAKLQQQQHHQQQQQQQQFVQEQDSINLQAISLENCLYINESEMNSSQPQNYVEYVMPMASNHHETIFEQQPQQVLSQPVSVSPSQPGDVTSSSQPTILAFISDQYSQPIQLIKNLSPANFETNQGGQLIMIKSNDQLVQFHASDLNNNNSNHHIKIEGELPSDLAALDTASLYRIN